MYINLYNFIFSEKDASDGSNRNENKIAHKHTHKEIKYKYASIFNLK